MKNINLGGTMPYELDGYIINKIRETIDSCFDKMKILSEWLTIEEACAYLKITKPTLWALSKKGVLVKHYLNEMPRYKRSELDKAFKTYQKGENHE